MMGLLAATRFDRPVPIQASSLARLSTLLASSAGRAFLETIGQSLTSRRRNCIHLAMKRPSRSRHPQARMQRLHAPFTRYAGVAPLAKSDPYALLLITAPAGLGSPCAGPVEEPT